jgi:hypothetical protein
VTVVDTSLRKLLSVACRREPPGGAERPISVRENPIPCDGVGVEQLTQRASPDPLASARDGHDTDHPDVVAMQRVVSQMSNRYCPRTSLARGRNLNAGGTCNYPGGLNYNDPHAWTHTNNDPAQWPLLVNQNRSVVSSSWTTSQNSFVISTSNFNNIRRHMNAFHVRVTNGDNHAVFVDNIELLPS